MASQGVIFNRYECRDETANRPNSGTGNAYADRGAYEIVGVGSKPASLARVVGGGPLDVIASARLKSTWTLDGPIGVVA